MRITVSHDKTPEEIRRNIDRSLDDVFKGMPIGPVQISDEKRMWVGDRLDFSFNARAAFMVVPVKGYVLVEQRQVTVEVDLPSFLNQFIPEQKMKAAIEGQVKGLLT